jgi:hypothetical protein
MLVDSVLRRCVIDGAEAPGLEEPVPFSSRGGVQATVAAYSNVARRDPVSNCPLQGMYPWLGTGRRSELGLHLGERAAPLRFHSNRTRGETGVVCDAKALKGKGEIFLGGA